MMGLKKLYHFFHVISIESLYRFSVHNFLEDKLNFTMKLWMRTGKCFHLKESKKSRAYITSRKTHSNYVLSDISHIQIESSLLYICDDAINITFGENLDMHVKSKTWRMLARLFHAREGKGINNLTCEKNFRSNNYPENEYMKKNVGFW